MANNDFFGQAVSAFFKGLGQLTLAIARLCINLFFAVINGIIKWAGDNPKATLLIVAILGFLWALNNVAWFMEAAATVIGIGIVVWLLYKVSR